MKKILLYLLLMASVATMSALDRKMLPEINYED